MQTIKKISYFLWACVSPNYDVIITIQKRGRDGRFTNRS